MATSSDLRRRTRLDADDRREQILQAAQVLFATRPYESVSTGDIAAAAGTTRTNIHHHFGTKRDLFLEIVDRFSRLPLDLGSPTAGTSTTSVVSTVIGRWLDAVEQNAETFMTMLHASSSSDPQVSGVLVASMRAWESRLSVIVGFDPSDETHRAVIRSYQSMVSTATAEWLEARNLTKAQVHDVLTQTLVRLGEITA
jgi:AcrR family transcriptional regulator